MRLMVEELGGGIVAGSPMEFWESSGKTSHIVSHSHSILVMSLRRLACNEEVALGDRGTYRSTCGKDCGKESRLECSTDWQLSVGWDLYIKS